jgi:hypothetical protein
MNELIKIGCLLAAIGLTSTAQGADEYEELRRYKACIETVKRANDRLDVMLKTWFTDEQSSHHLARNFSIVSEGHARYFVKLKTFYAHGAVPITTIDQAIAKTRELERA